MIFNALHRSILAREHGESGIPELLSLLDLISGGVHLNDRWRSDMRRALQIRDPDERYHHVVSSIVRLLSTNRLWIRQAKYIQRGEEFKEAF